MIVVLGPKPTSTAGLLGLSLASVGCQNEYPIAATFCDDFCHATIPSGCPYEPENCVRDCELWRVRTECRGALDTLLGCYRDASSDAFVCRGAGEGVVVRDQVCQTERDRLHTCQLPEMNECLAPCRQLQQLADAAARDRVVTGSESSGPSGADEGRCLLIEHSCETLCWNVLTVGELEVSAELDTASPLLDVPVFTGDGGAAPWAELVRLASERCGVELPL